MNYKIHLDSSVGEEEVWNIEPFDDITTIADCLDRKGIIDWLGVNFKPGDVVYWEHLDEDDGNYRTIVECENQEMKE